MRHFGVYAIVYNAVAERLLVIEKIRGPYAGRFDLPGGTPETHEQPIDTLRREVEEETGCTVAGTSSVVGYLTRFAFFRDTTPVLFLHSGLIYRARISGELKRSGDGEDSGGCVWLPIRECTADTSTPFAVMATYLIGRDTFARDWGG